MYATGCQRKKFPLSSYVILHTRIILKGYTFKKITLKPPHPFKHDLERKTDAYYRMTIEKANHKN